MRTFEEIVNDVNKFFDIRELVSRAVYDKYQTNAWRFFDPRLLETLLVLRRDILCIPLVVNNWRSGGNIQQRGYRENTCDIVSTKTKNNAMYVSGHTLGMAVDFSSSKSDAKTMRKIIREHADKLPYPVRLEDDASAPTWVHIGVDVPHTQKAKVSVFKG